MAEPVGPPPRPRGMRTFLLIWSGQVVSNLGSGLSAFALGVWAYRQTGSATALALITLFATLPNTLLSPLAGALIDRWGQRRALLINNLGSGACTLSLALLYWSGGLQMWQVYALVLASRCFNVFQLPAFTTATALLVPPGQLLRANGMVQTGMPAALIAAPLLAASAMDVIGVGGVIFLDCALLSVRGHDARPEPHPAPAGLGRGRAGEGVAAPRVALRLDLHPPPARPPGAAAVLRLRQLLPRRGADPADAAGALLRLAEDAGGGDVLRRGRRPRGRDRPRGVERRTATAAACR